MINVVVTDEDGDTETFLVADHAAWWAVEDGARRAFGVGPEWTIELYASVRGASERINDPATNPAMHSLADSRGTLWLDMRIV